MCDLMSFKFSRVFFVCLFCLCSFFKFKKKCDVINSSSGNNTNILRILLPIFFILLLLLLLL